MPTYGRSQRKSDIRKIMRRSVLTVLSHTCPEFAVGSESIDADVAVYHSA